MAYSRGNLNVIKAGPTEFLLTTVGGGAKVHLSRRVEPGHTGGRAAVLEYYVDESYVLWAPTIGNYDRLLLLDPVWCQITLCGREWVTMVGGDGGPVHQWDEPALAPTCRRCLALMDELFPRPEPDKRLPAVVQVLTDLVLEHGYAEIHGIPGDQQAELRRRVRAQVKKRSGHSIQSIVREALVVFVCEPIHEQHADEHARAVAEAVSRLVLTGEVPQSSPPWRTFWDNWELS